jgi:hypothetical protein
MEAEKLSIFQLPLDFKSYLKYSLSNYKYNIITYIRAYKYMNLAKWIVVACSAIGLTLCGNGLGAKAAETQPGNSGRTFTDWCREKASLSPEAKLTVEVLLKTAGTTECDAANQKLSSVTELNLNFHGISDIKPL